MESAWVQESVVNSGKAWWELNSSLSACSLVTILTRRHVL
jgi:hypothetical protein